jgi:hypothetical protein
VKNAFLLMQRDMQRLACEAIHRVLLTPTPSTTPGYANSTRVGKFHPVPFFLDIMIASAKE